MLDHACHFDAQVEPSGRADANARRAHELWLHARELHEIKRRKDRWRANNADGNRCIATYGGMRVEEIVNTQTARGEDAANRDANASRRDVADDR